jgi:Competence protein J (ComJ)
MTSNFLSVSPDLVFGYSQFFVYDAALRMRALEWTERHTRQGFARSARVVAVRTLLEFGYGTVRVAITAPSSPIRDFERILLVPLEITGGGVCVDGPEEQPCTRRINIESGHYRLTIAQRVTDETHEDISLWFERADIPLRRSQILVADGLLEPEYPLLETSKPVS